MGVAAQSTGRREAPAAGGKSLSSQSGERNVRESWQKSLLDHYDYITKSDFVPNNLRSSADIAGGLGRVTFDSLVLNSGSGMNISSGAFAAPDPGHYLFTVSGRAYNHMATLNLETSKGSKTVIMDVGYTSYERELTREMVVYLEKGDTASLEVVTIRGSNAFFKVAEEHPFIWRGELIA